MGFGPDTKEVIAFMQDVAAGASGSIRERVKAAGTIEQVMVRFYLGQELALHINPRIVRKGNMMEELITYPTNANQYLAGDDDHMTFDVSVPCDNDDEIAVFYDNTDASYTYTVAVFITVDYMGGQNRVGV